MFSKSILTVATLFCTAALQAAVTFTSQPAMAYNASSQKWDITFAMSETTDVEVTIVDSRDSSIVRRFAAGSLGSNPPPPFSANTLNQSIEWDGLDELGGAVTDTAGLVVRVRAGMSVSLDQIVGDNPYYFNTISGMAKDDAGSVYVYGSYGSGGYNMTLRQFDASGNYVRTVIPFPAGLDTSAVRGWGYNLRSDDTYCLEYVPSYSSWLAALAFSPVAMNSGGFSLKSFTMDNKAFFTHGNNFMLIGANGSSAGELPLITSPAAAANGGPQFYTKSPDGGSIFISGAYSWYGGYLEVHHLDTTGFWRDGAIYRMDVATGVVTLWHTFIPSDSVPDFGTERYAGVGPGFEGDWSYLMKWAAIHGMAFDDSGHVFICDRVRREIGVYDTATFAKVGSIPVTYPHMVEVNKTTGEIYVLSQQVMGYGTGTVSLRKFSGWRDPTLRASRINFLTTMSTAAPLERFFVVYGSGSPVLWLSQSAIYLFRDDGDTLVLTRNLNDLCADERAGRVPTVYERIAVNRKNETVYANNSWAGLFQITDWSAPKAVACTTSDRQRLWAGEAAVSPDGFLYARTGNGFAGPLNKFTTDPYPAPVLFKSTNQIHDDVYGKMGIAYGDLGFTVTKEGRAIVMEMGPLGFRRGAVVQGTDPDSSFHDSLAVIFDGCGTTSCSNPGGIKVDFDNNLYVGYSVRPADHVVPAGWAGDAGYLSGVGAIYKLPPSGTLILAGNVTGLTAYPQGLGVFSPNGPCACRTPRFDLDPWGRLFIPNAITCEVTVADNAGNDIVKFGEYGNADANGPGIPLASPLDVAASDNYLYISDWLNARLVRVKMNFELENMHLPEAAADRVGATTRVAPTLAAAPNPFNPAVTVSLSVKGAKVRIYDARGRMAADLSGKFVGGNAIWNASGLASGLYVIKAEAGNVILTKKIMLSK